MDWTRLLSPQRFGQEYKTPDAGINWRSEFEKDFDRIIFSHPFRRLQDKTQVFPLPEQDFVHTRLTHSLEVSSVGKSLGRKAGEFILKNNPEIASRNFTAFDFGAITMAASLAHDLGNPPFGHAGEEAISDFFKHNPVAQAFKQGIDEKQWADLCHFEGNAQGFRILSKYSYQGLKLTMATLASFTKYPTESLLSQHDKDRKSQKKYGFFQSEKLLFQTLSDTVGLRFLGTGNDLVWCRHPLAFLVEAADDICYSIIDLEDGCRLGLVDFDTTKSLLVQILGNVYDESKLSRIEEPNEQIGYLRAMAIGILIDQCIEVFMREEKNMLAGKFDQALMDLIPANSVLKQISLLSIDKIYRSRIVLETEAAGFEIVNGILEKFLPAAFSKVFDQQNSTGKEKSIARLLPDQVFRLGTSQGPNEYNLIRNILDYVSGMTDSDAIGIYKKIKGISLPKGFPTKF